ncbi:MIB [Mytilus coruscus]|uniref:MIB n=1 Tax=Mytilus coruscus TaxID=42192 RepID=A0A6J8AXY5_MYTCO|nr:MIB [Mytilus coruscus]
MTAVSSSRDGFKTETSIISPGERSRTDGFDDIRPAHQFSEEQDYQTNNLISTEIQDESRVQGCLSYFLTFAGETITDRYAGEKIKQHSRVVKTSWTPKEDMQLGTIVKVKKSGKEVHVQWDKIEEKVNLLNLRLVAATEISSRVVLISRTITHSSTVSGMQVGRNVNLRLLDNVPIKKIEQGSRVVKKSWIPKEEMPSGTIIMLKTSRREAYVQWDQIEEKVDLHDIRLESSQQCANREKEEGSRVVKIAWTSKEESYVGTIVKVNKTKQTARVQWDKQPEEKVKLFNLRLVGNYLTDKIEIGSRVVKKTQTTREEIPFGTIVNIHQSTKEVQVQWDKPVEKVNPLDLRLYDNTPSGVKHTNVKCDECYTYPLRGIRWKCLHCDSYDLCSVCYMADEHNVSHIFSRIQSEDSKGKEMPARFDVKLTGYAFACGIQENAEVSLRKDNRKKGVVLVIREDEIEVQWLSHHNRSRHNILELQCEDTAARQFYPDHLPILGKDTLGHLDVDFNCNNTAQKIQVNIRYRIEKEQKRSYKPVLYLIFANNQDTDHKKDRCTLMDEIFEYSEKTKLPCHVIGKKVLFLHGSSRVVCIHHTTSNHTIKELVKKGIRIFERGDTNNKESEIKYFIRMAEYVLDEKVLPVIISMRNGGLNEDVLVSASSLLLPIIRLKKSSPDVAVLTLENGSIEKATEHITNLKTPWTVRKSETLIVIKNAETTEEISAINEVQSNLDFEALICHVVIGVSIANKHKVYETDKEVYVNVLSMYLLKIEKWRIPEDAFKMAFDHRSIEYIYEQDLTTAFASGLRSDLVALSRLTDLPTDWKEKDIKRAVSNSDVIGLIYLALLRKKFYSGAIQLIDTGFVCIRHILVGCKILQDVSNDKKNEQIQRETSQRLKLYFTERATLITGFIYEATSNNDLVANELGESVNHAGRLLVNHGYLEDAIKTENKAFLDNKTVTDILNKMWYGEEKSLFRQVFDKYAH